MPSVVKNWTLSLFSLNYLWTRIRFNSLCWIEQSLIWKNSPYSHGQKYIYSSPIFMTWLPFFGHMEFATGTRIFSVVFTGYKHKHEHKHKLGHKRIRNTNTHIHILCCPHVTNIKISTRWKHEQHFSCIFMLVITTPSDWTNL